ncbi:MAG: ATP-binding protein [Prolixibacteraceae bacterium]
MDQPHVNKKDDESLRHKAEEQQKSRKTETNKMVSEDEMLKLIHELEVHQIELEMQNAELIQAKENAKLAEKKHTELFDFAPSGYIYLTPSGDISELNFMAARMLGKERSNLLKKKFESFISKKSRPLFNQFFTDVFSKHEKQSCEVSITTEDNASLLVTINGVEYQLNEYCFLTLTDITDQVQSKIALHESEEKYHINKNDLKKAQSVAHIGNWKWDINTEECIWSDEMFQIFGIDKNSFQGKLCDVIPKVAHPDDLHLVLPSKPTESGQNSPVEYRIIMPDKSIRYIWSEEGETIYSTNGLPLFFTGIVQDITKYKLTEIELTEAKVTAEKATNLSETAKIKAEHATKIAEEAVKAKQQFLSNMSHEIRTPMNVIIGFTKVMLKTDLTIKQKEYLAAIKMSGDTLIVLINDILDLAKVDAGKMTFNHTPFKMAMSISAMLHLFEPKIQEKNLFLNKEYDRRIPEVLIGDPVRLHQIIINLVSNAVKFTDKGEITVGVHLLNEDNEKVTLEFAVSDTGIGIDEDKLDKIFENFQQAYSGTSSLYGGTGLGLAIVKQFVEMQGGTIHVDSKINIGSTFRFNLDFQKTNREAEYENEIEELDSDIKGLKILVVEDIALNQLLMKTMLEDFGFTCDLAGNGKLAIAKLQTETYDVILMDLQMPEMNGFQATEHIRKIMHSNIPIMALTADVTTVDLAKCTAAGMNDYIAKPVNEKILYNKIAALIKKNIQKKDTPVEQNTIRESQKCIDLEYLIKHTRSNPELMMKMITIYLQQTPPLITTMKLSLEANDWELLYSAVHKLIPSFSIMGINNEFEIMAKQVQEYAQKQLASEKLPKLVLQLETVCKQACKELEVEYDTIKKTLKE